MQQLTSDQYETETAGQTNDERVVELAQQNWNRDKAQTLATIESIDLSDAHWAVIVFLRHYYLQYGLPIHARQTARALDTHFATQGGNKYLRQLFPNGPVSQGSRIGKLRTPAFAVDSSFGTAY